jgi:hypothetical protein
VAEQEASSWVVPETLEQVQVQFPPVLVTVEGEPLAHKSSVGGALQ